MHGLGASVYIWRFIFKPLAKYFRVTALDLPGFGRSSKPIADYGLDAQSDRLLTALDRLDIKTAHFVGSSMGGALSLWLAKIRL
ncbi:MAG: alpha/beta fold hydrolase [Bdellovibrionales bacterium]